MKNFNLMTFVSGLLSGIIIFTLLSFTSSDDLNDILSFKLFNTQENVSKIEPEKALTYRQNYEALNPDKIKAINISLQQWSAINKTVEDLGYDISKLSGFRIYFGLKTKDESAEKVSMVYTIDEQRQQTQQIPMIHMAAEADDNVHQQCPPYCD